MIDRLRRPLPQISTLLQRLRAELGLSQRDMAKRLGMDQASLSKRETGDRVTTVFDMQVIADALSCELSFTFTPLGAPPLAASMDAISRLDGSIIDDLARLGTHASRDGRFRRLLGDLGPEQRIVLHRARRRKSS